MNFKISISRRSRGVVAAILFLLIQPIGRADEFELSAGISLKEDKSVLSIVKSGKSEIPGTIRGVYHARLVPLPSKGVAFPKGMTITGGLKEKEEDDGLTFKTTLNKLDGTNFTIKSELTFVRTLSVEGSPCALLSFPLVNPKLTEKDSLEIMTESGPKTILLKSAEGEKLVKAKSVTLKLGWMVLTVSPGAKTIMTVEDARVGEDTSAVKIRLLPENYTDKSTQSKGKKVDIEGKIGITSR